jgi:hypothetical protein
MQSALCAKLLLTLPGISLNVLHTPLIYASKTCDHIPRRSQPSLKLCQPSPISLRWCFLLYRSPRNRPLWTEPPGNNNNDDQPTGCLQIRQWRTGDWLELGGGLISTPKWEGNRDFLLSNSVASGFVLLDSKFYKSLSRNKVGSPSLVFMVLDHFRGPPLRLFGSVIFGFLHPCADRARFA